MLDFGAAELAALGLFLVAFSSLYNNQSMRLPSGIAIGFLCGFAPFALLILFRS